MDMNASLDVDSILERARQRRLATASNHNDTTVFDDASETGENTAPKTSTLDSSAPLKTSSPKPSPTKILAPRQATSGNTPILRQETPNKAEEKASARRSMFAELASRLDEQEDDETCRAPGNRPKEAFMKGASPRLSMGENAMSPERWYYRYTRPQVLFSPQGACASPRDTSPVKSALSKASPGAKSDERRIRFAQPIANTNATADDSRLVESFATVNESCSYIDRDVTSDDYGTHTFMVKKTTSSSSLKVCSPKPFRANSTLTHSPVVFDPTSTSSPVVTSEARIRISGPVPMDSSVCALDEIEAAAKQATATPTMPRREFAWEKKSPLKQLSEGRAAAAGGGVHSPVRAAAIENASAKKIAQVLEEKLRSGGSAPSTVVAMRPGAFVPSSAAAARQSQPEMEREKLQTQWRGQAGTPVVHGADPTEPSRPEFRASNLKSLRNRWEFSSKTGTALHPDESESALLTAAQRAKDRELPRKVWSRQGDEHAVTPNKDEQVNVSQQFTTVPTLSPQRPAYNKSLTSSPVGKSPRIEIEKHSPDMVNEESIVDGSISDDEIAEKSGDASRIITSAFEFIDGERCTSRSPQKSPVKIPMAIQERVEEEEEEEEAVVEQEQPKEEPVFRAPPPPPVDTPTKDDDSIGLMHTVSFYRKRRHEAANRNSHVERMEIRSSPLTTHPSQVIGAHGSSMQQQLNKNMLEAERHRLEKEAGVQKAIISQASRAISVARSRVEFRGSREEVDAQRALLLATESYRSMVHELERLDDSSRRVDGPRGGVTLKRITIPLARDFVNGHINMSSDSAVYYFLVLFKYAGNVQHTALLSSDEGVRRKGALQFKETLTLDNLPPDFQAHMEVYSLRSRREVFTHEEKYKLGKAATLKSKKPPARIPVGSEYAQHDSSFQLVGRLALDVHSATRTKFVLQDTIHPIEGGCTLNIKRFPIEKDEVEHRGFLSLFQRNNGQASWNRYWCVMSNGEMKFWRNPEDEHKKEWTVLVDLSTCAAEGAQPEPLEKCPYPHSFHIDVWVPKEEQTKDGETELERLRVMMAADTRDDLAAWLNLLNRTIRNLLLWSAPIGSE